MNKFKNYTLAVDGKKYQGKVKSYKKSNKQRVDELLQELDDLEESGCGEMAAYEIVAERNGFEDGCDLMEFIASNG